MDAQTASPLPDPSHLARSLADAESELSREARTLADARVGDLQSWFGLVERAAVLLRRTARDLERTSTTSPAAPGAPAGGGGRGEQVQAPLPAGRDPVQRRDSAPAAPLQGGAPRPDPAGGVISGSASVVPVSDLLAFLSGLRRSGMLWIETEREGFLVQLQEGAVVYAQGDNPPRGQLLGEVLVAAGALERDDLAPALEAAAQAHEVLGGWLVRAGRITPQDLTAALATQVQMIFDRMFEAHDARWQFEDGVRMVDSTDVSLNVIQLLLESARASDESQARSTLALGLPLARAG